MTDQLHQINVSYSSVEDRLLLRISTQAAAEYRIWLTRRFTELLMGLLNKEMDQRGGMPNVAANQETTKLIKEGALEKKYEDKNSTYPLGERGILACRINAGTREDGNLSLEVLPEKGQGITLNLNQSLIYMLHSVLSQGMTQAGWQLSSSDTVSTQVH